MVGLAEPGANWLCPLFWKKIQPLVQSTGGDPTPRVDVHHMKTRMTLSNETVLARPLAPEEIRRGQYVTLLDEIVELPSFLWTLPGDDLKPNELVRMKIKSGEGGIPLRVKSICLPFISVQTPQQETRVLDLRKVQLVRLSPEFGKSVSKALAKQSQPASLGL